MAEGYGQDGVALLGALSSITDQIGLGKPLKLLGTPVQDRIPIYLGVGGAQTVEQAGAIADGWLPSLFSPEHADMVFAPLLRGIEKSGRQRSDVCCRADGSRGVA
ncbi:LLM class flavin-dependent oxidoreductase [Nocardia jiangxiensis]|uniref:LLM class flavin-dependent oxidoreductase n=1 Tax=Nocardia jiangxiensis TaxID=282685 RepID=A0ABW6S9F9_9NOCA